MAEQAATSTQALPRSDLGMGSPLPINVWSLVQHLLLDNSRQMGLIISAALALSGAVALMMWLYGSAYRAVLPGLSDRDAGEVVAALEQSGVDFKIDSITGDIKVPEGRVHEIRLLLAGQGLPRGASDNMLGRETSMELGRSKSEETAWLQRVRESEMARTISSLSSVQSARVHLAIPRQSVFIRERTQTSASVVLQVYPGTGAQYGRSRGDSAPCSIQRAGPEPRENIDHKPTRASA